MADSRKPISPNPPRWKQNSEPESIVVPGLDTNASVIDQIEQIEQLITIKLQNIDENFSKIQNVLANKILPAVKKYAVGTEPIREAAKFWTSFYEQAAQIRIPSYDDHSTVNEIPSDRHDSLAENDRTTGSQAPHDHPSNYEPSIVNTENSFLPGHAAFSSTPATARAVSTLDSFSSQGSSDPSWTNSMESPLLRLKNEIQNFSSEDESSFTPAAESQVSSFHQGSPPSNQGDTTILPPSNKGKGREQSEPLLRNVLRHNLYNASESSASFATKSVSPLKFRGKPKTPIPKDLNPYLPPDTDPKNWNGLVDLQDPLTLTPLRKRSTKSSSYRKPKTTVIEDSDDDSFDGLPEGMSPPVFMSPARPPRSSAELGLLKVGQSSVKQAAARLTRDLLEDVQANSAMKPRNLYGYSRSGVESSMSTVPTPPSLSRYHQDEETSESIADSTLESMIRRVGLNVPSTSGISSTPGLRLRPRIAQTITANEPYPSPKHHREDDSVAASDNYGPFTPTYGDEYQPQDLDSDSDSLDLDEINNTAHPSAAFLMASQRRPGDDDSFGSSNHSSDSLTDEDVGGLVPVHPFAGVVQDDGFDDDDSFDYDHGDEQEETVFGVPPAQRIKAQSAVQPSRTEGLKILGGNLLEDTIGAQIVAGVMGVEESPTPAWGSSSNLRS